MLKNKGSIARDFLAYERNFLTQCRFGLLLSVLSSSFLLRARIPTPHTPNPDSIPIQARLPFGYIFFAFGFCGICLALCYYALSYKQSTQKRAFLRVSKLQTITLAIMSALVLATCIFLLAERL